MAIEILNPATHAAAAMAPPPPCPHMVQIVAAEFAAAAACCPVFFAKHPDTGQFYAAALFGFVPGENLVPGAPFRPLDLERAGFFVAGEQVAIDPAHPRFAATDGAPLFEPDGRPAEALRRMQRVLGEMASGVAAADAFIAALLSLRLIEPIDIALRFDDGERLQLDGLYTVSLDAVADLDDAAALRLFRDGHLQLAYAMHQSLRQIPVLAKRRNERLTA